VSFPDQVRLCGGRPVFVESHAGDGFRIRARPVLGAITAATRAIVLNSPCNPTGGMIDGDDLRAIVEAAAARDILVVSDETYERFVYDGPAFTSCAAFAAARPDTVIVVGSFSKTYSMTGWRVGYALGPTSVMQGLAAIQSHATSNPTSFAMSGALAAQRAAEPDVLAMIDEFRIRRDLVVEGLNALPGVTCSPPAGAFYAFPHVAACYRTGEGSTEFAERLLEEARVAVVPGAAFGNDAHVRLSFACSREDLREGLRRMGAMLGASSAGAPSAVQKA
jgi:aspartate aminotransferase